MIVMPIVSFSLVEINAIEDIKAKLMAILAIANSY